jgi:hypothetical protein
LITPTDVRNWLVLGGKTPDTDEGADEPEVPSFVVSANVQLEHVRTKCFIDHDASSNPVFRPGPDGTNSAAATASISCACGVVNKLMVSRRVVSVDIVANDLAAHAGQDLRDAIADAESHNYLDDLLFELEQRGVIKDDGKGHWVIAAAASTITAPPEPEIEQLPIPQPEPAPVVVDTVEEAPAPPVAPPAPKPKPKPKPPAATVTTVPHPTAAPTTPTPTPVRVHVSRKRARARARDTAPTPPAATPTPAAPPAPPKRPAAPPVPELPPLPAKRPFNKLTKAERETPVDDYHTQRANRPRNRRPKARCPYCGNWSDLTPQNTVWKHLHGLDPCPGIGYPPENLRITPRTNPPGVYDAT